jgi:hypothetical protein
MALLYDFNHQMVLLGISLTPMAGRLVGNSRLNVSDQSGVKSKNAAPFMVANTGYPPLCHYLNGVEV